MRIFGLKGKERVVLVGQCAVGVEDVSLSPLKTTWRLTTSRDLVLHRIKPKSFALSLFSGFPQESEEKGKLVDLFQDNLLIYSRKYSAN